MVDSASQDRSPKRRGHSVRRRLVLQGHRVGACWRRDLQHCRPRVPAAHGDGVKAQSPARLATVAAIVAAAAAVCLVPVGSAGGATSRNREQVRLTPAGKAAARAVVLKRADLGPLPDWVGGRKKPDRSSPGCPNWHPKESDLVLTGDAETQWKRPGLVLDSEAQVLATPRMVLLDWKRTMRRQLLTCLGSLSAKATNGEHLVSVRWLAFPRVVPHTRVIRLVIDVKRSTRTVRMMMDLLAMAQGRTEISLTTIAPLVEARALRPAEFRLANLLAYRVRM